MTTELWLLFWSLPLYGCYLGAQSILYRMHYGLIFAAGARDEEAPPSPWLARADRALRNFLETWPAFIILALIAHLAVPADALILWGGLIYLGGRIIYLPLYVIGIFMIRSLVWCVASTGLLLMFLGVLF
jgi:uncharacterized MAPEG superfamily protein